MAILGGVPVLSCSSLDATLQFYQKLLQFVVVKKREQDGQVVWAHLMHGDTTLMLQGAVTDSENTENSNISLYYFVDNISELHHFIKVNHPRVSEILTTDYQMQEFRLQDPEGNTVTLGQSVNRLS